MESILTFLSSLSGAYLYLLIFSLFIIGSLGIVGPEELILIFCGYATYHGLTNPVMITLVCLAGILTADTLIYSYGWMLGRSIIRRQPPKVIMPPRKLSRTEKFVQKYGARSVAIARFFSYLRYAVFFTAGIYRLRLRKIVAIDTVAASIFVPLVIFIGYTSAPTLESITSVIGKIHDTGAIVLFFLILGISLLFFLFRFVWVKKTSNG